MSSSPPMERAEAACRQVRDRQNSEAQRGAARHGASYGARRARCLKLQRAPGGTVARTISWLGDGQVMVLTANGPRTTS